MSTDALRQWVADNTGLTAIWLHPNAPRPDTPFASVQVLQVARVGEPYRTPVDHQGNATVTVNRDVTVSIVVYESDANPDPRAALERADTLRDTLDLETVRETLAANGWTFRAVELLTDTPSAGQTDWEPRATFDVRFGIGREIAEELGIVEYVDYDGELYVADASDEQQPLKVFSVKTIDFKAVANSNIQLSDNEGNILQLDEEGKLFSTPLLESRNW